jgi:hypothetical protein
VTHRVPLGSLLCLIDPYTDDLARRAHRDIEGNCQPDRRRRVQIGGKPPQERRNTGKRTRGCDNETSITSLYILVSWPARVSEVSPHRLLTLYACGGSVAEAMKPTAPRRENMEE